VVDGIVRGDAEEAVLSRAAALGWEPSAAATVLAAAPPPDDPPGGLRRAQTGRQGGAAGATVRARLAAHPGRRWSHDDERVLAKLAAAFGDGPVVAGPTVTSLADAHRSASEALSGLRAVIGWPSAPRPVRSIDLLPSAPSPATRTPNGC